MGSLGAGRTLSGGNISVVGWQRKKLGGVSVSRGHARALALRCRTWSSGACREGGSRNGTGHKQKELWAAMGGNLYSSLKVFLSEKF